MELSICRTVPLSYLPDQLAHQEGLLSVQLKLRLVGRLIKSLNYNQN